MSENRGSGIRLLMVDDEEEFLSCSAKALSRRGFEVKTASDGRTALRLLEDRSFDVVILDMKMPGMSGLEVVREISARWSGLPVIVLTGHAMSKESVELMRLGVSEYLLKPCDSDKLAEVARRVAAIEPAPPRATSKHTETARVRLLVVDDEREFLDGLSRTLGRRGMDVTTAQSGDEALALLKRDTFDVAVLDVKMPGMDGLELLGRLRREYPDMNVLLLTGHPTVDQALKGVEKGAYDYLLKPHDVDSLALKIAAAYHEGRARRKKD